MVQSDFKLHDVAGAIVPRAMRGEIVAPIVQMEPFDPHIAGLVGVDLLSFANVKVLRDRLDGGRQPSDHQGTIAL